MLPVSQFDDELRFRIARAIYSNSSFWNYAAMANPPIRVVVNRGRVTLEGVVQSNVERMLARSLASGFGEFEVKNELKTDAEVREAMEARKIELDGLEVLGPGFRVLTNQMAAMNVITTSTPIAPNKARVRNRIDCGFHPRLNLERRALLALGQRSVPTRRCCRARSCFDGALWHVTLLGRCRRTATSSVPSHPTLPTS